VALLSAACLLCADADAAIIRQKRIKRFFMVFLIGTISGFPGGQSNHSFPNYTTYRFHPVSHKHRSWNYHRAVGFRKE
jgi:hypothetical protein